MKVGWGQHAGIAGQKETMKSMNKKVTLLGVFIAPSRAPPPPLCQISCTTAATLIGFKLDNKQSNIWRGWGSRCLILFPPPYNHLVTQLDK